jgi:hippurate hydrolase
MAVGHFSIRPGPFYAATDNFTLNLSGKGGHAAYPHRTVDTTLMACTVVQTLQSIVSRNTDPLESVVVSVTSFRTESEAFNVIPERVEIRGTVRTFDPAMRLMAEQRLKSIVHGTVEAFGGAVDLVWRPGYPSMVNSERETQFAAEVAAKISGPAAVDTNCPAIMGGEDFAYMLQACPGAYIQVGNGPTAEVHHPEYNFNDDAIPYGASYWAELVETRMPAA